MELGQGTRQNLNAQRCTWSSIGFSVFSLCLYVSGFYKNPVVNKYSYFYGSHCLLRRVFLPATPFYQATSHMVRWPARAVFHNECVCVCQLVPEHVSPVVLCVCVCVWPSSGARGSSVAVCVCVCVCLPVSF